MRRELFAILWTSSLFAADNVLEQQLRYNALQQQLIQAYLAVARGGGVFQENPIWIFNNFIYEQNEAGQWIRVGCKDEKTCCFDFEAASEETLEFLKEHQIYQSK